SVAAPARSAPARVSIRGCAGPQKSASTATPCTSSTAGTRRSGPSPGPTTRDAAVRCAVSCTWHDDARVRGTGTAKRTASRSAQHRPHVRADEGPPHLLRGQVQVSATPAAGLGSAYRIVDVQTQRMPGTRATGLIAAQHPTRHVDVRIHEGDGALAVLAVQFERTAGTPEGREYDGSALLQPAAHGLDGARDRTGRTPPAGREQQA